MAWGLTLSIFSAFSSFSNADFQRFFFFSTAAMMADNIEHVISYWVIFQKFHSPALGGFAVISPL